MKTKYYLITSAVFILVMLTIKYNYLYYELDIQSDLLTIDIENNQQLINKRKYLLSALNTSESLMSVASPSELAPVVSKLPKFLENDDHKIAMNSLWRYKKLHKLMTTYVFKSSSISEEYQHDFRSKIVKELSDFKIDFEHIIIASQQDVVNQEKQLKKLNIEKDDVFESSVFILLMMVCCFYYFLYSIRTDNKFKLKDISEKSAFDNLIDKYVSDNLVQIEHSCQRFNYHNGLVKKQLLQQQNSINNIKQDYKIINDVISKINSVNISDSKAEQDVKLSFKLYAKAVDANKKIIENLESINNESIIINKQLEKNRRYIKSIFYSSQQISDNIKAKTKNKSVDKTSNANVRIKKVEYV